MTVSPAIRLETHWWFPNTTLMSLYRLHSTNYPTIIHYTLHSIHYTLYLFLHFTLYILLFTLYTLHSKHYTQQHTNYIVHPTFYTLHLWLPNKTLISLLSVDAIWHILVVGRLIQLHNFVGLFTNSALWAELV